MNCLSLKMILTWVWVVFGVLSLTVTEPCIPALPNIYLANKLVLKLSGREI